MTTPRARPSCSPKAPPFIEEAGNLCLAARSSDNISKPDGTWQDMREARLKQSIVLSQLWSCSVCSRKFLTTSGSFSIMNASALGTKSRMNTCGKRLCIAELRGLVIYLVFTRRKERKARWGVTRFLGRGYIEGWLLTWFGWIAVTDCNRLPCW